MIRIYLCRRSYTQGPTDPRWSNGNILVYSMWYAETTYTQTLNEHRTPKVICTTRICISYIKRYGKYCLFVCHDDVLYTKGFWIIRFIRRCVVEGLLLWILAADIYVCSIQNEESVKTFRLMQPSQPWDLGVQSNTQSKVHSTSSFGLLG